jgi:hypothetical protein
MLGCAVDTPAGRRIRVYSLHLFPFHEFRVPDNDELVTKMWCEFWACADRLVEKGELILAGDFNQIERESAARRYSSRTWRFYLGNQVTTSFGLSLDGIVLSWSPPSAMERSVPTFSDHHLAIVDVPLADGHTVRDAHSQHPDLGTVLRGRRLEPPVRDNRKAGWDADG